jgi:N-acetylneuraminic acid mutarotase
MPTARQSAVAASAVNPNGRSVVYVFGGLDLDDEEGHHIFPTVEAYNITTNRWVTKQGVSPFKAEAFNGVSLIGGKFYLPGGELHTGDGYFKLRILQVYDPVADVWTRKSDMPVASAYGVSGVIGGQLYVLTGDNNSELNGQPCPDCPFVNTRRLFRYDPAQDRWFRRAQCPNFHVRGMAGVVDGKLYVTGGLGRGGQSLDIYDPRDDTWSRGAPLPSPHSAGVGVVLGGRLYVVGGGTGQVVAYNPRTNRWAARAPFPVPTARLMSGATARLDGKDRIVVQVGLEDGFPNNGRATYVYTP